MPRLAYSLETLRDQYLARYPKIAKSRYGWVGDALHAVRTSDHNPNKQGVVTAMDVPHDPKNGLDCTVEKEKVIRDVRVKYVIFNSHIWEPGKGWKLYTGTNPHRAHMHISVKVDAADNPTKWNLESEENMKLSTAREVNLLWQLNGMDRSPTDKEVRDALGRSLEEYVGNFLQTAPVKANLAKVKYYDADLERLNKVKEILK